MSGLYGHRSNSSASSSPPAHGGQGDNGGPNGGLVVPQPINAAKGGHGGHSHHGSHGNHGHHNHHHMSHSGSGTTNGSAGRKYQCKMCPQVGKVRKAIFLFTWSWFRLVSGLSLITSRYSFRFAIWFRYIRNTSVCEENCVFWKLFTFVINSNMNAVDTLQR